MTCLHTCCTKTGDHTHRLSPDDCPVCDGIHRRDHAMRTGLTQARAALAAKRDRKPLAAVAEPERLKL